jgi:hypothetical protein
MHPPTKPSLPPHPARTHPPQAAAPLLALLAACCCVGGSLGQGDFSGPGLGAALPGVPSFVLLAAPPPFSLAASDCALVGAILRNFHPGAPIVTATSCSVSALPAQPSVSVLNYTVRARVPPSAAIACGRPARSRPWQVTLWITRYTPGKPLVTG